MTMPKLFAASLRMLYRDKQALFWAIAFPVIFAVVFALFDFEQAPETEVAVVAERSTTLSDGLLAGLRQVESFEVRQRADLGAARRDLEEGELDVVLAVPDASGLITAYFDETNFEVNQLALGAVDRLVGEMNLRMAGIGSPPIRLRRRPSRPSRSTTTTSCSPGWWPWA